MTTAGSSRSAPGRSGSTARSVDPLAHHVLVLERVARRRARVRHRALPHRLRALPVEPAHRRDHRDDAARPARHSGPGAALPRVHATCRWSRSPTPSASRCRTRIGSRRCRTACRPTCCRFRETPDDYLAFLGRISPEKRVDRAIEIARRAGLPLRVAAKIDAADRDVLRTGDRAALRRAVRRVHRRDRRGAEGRVPRRRAGAAVSDRLARAVRPGDDRSDGVRDAGGRVSAADRSARSSTTA